MSELNVVKRVLVAVDLTDDDAAKFVARAARWVKAIGATADLLYVDEAQVETPWIVDAGLRSALSSQYDWWHQQMTARLEDLVESMPESVRGDVLHVRGRAVVEIMRRVREYDAVIVGNRPTSGLSSLAHGVVAERVSQLARKPVLIIPRD